MAAGNILCISSNISLEKEVSVFNSVQESVLSHQ